MRANGKYDIPTGGLASRHGSTVEVEIGYGTIYMARLGSGSDGDVRPDSCRDFKYDPKLALEYAEFAVSLKGALKEFCGSMSDLVMKTVDGALTLLFR